MLFNNKKEVLIHATTWMNLKKHAMYKKSQLFKIWCVFYTCSTF